MKAAMIRKLALALVLAVTAAGTISAQRMHRLEADTSHYWYAYVRAGATVTVNVNGDDDTDLDLIVYSAPGVEVVSDYRVLRDASVRWTPARTGYVQVKVINTGDLWNEYTIDVNGGDLQ